MSRLASTSRTLLQQNGSALSSTSPRTKPLPHATSTPRRQNDELRFSEQSIPEEPQDVPQLNIPPPSSSSQSMSSPSATMISRSYTSSGESLMWSEKDDTSTAPSSPGFETQSTVDDIVDKMADLPVAALNFNTTAVQEAKPRRASTTLINNGEDIRRLLGEGGDVQKTLEQYCCGGGCCMLQNLPTDTSRPGFKAVEVPDNKAFHSLGITIGPLGLDSTLTGIPPVPESHVSFHSLPSEQAKECTTTVYSHPPKFVQPHPPYHVFSAPLYGARELTKPGAEKRTFHLDIDVTDYPSEAGDVEFKVGGAIGVCPPNDTKVVDDVFDGLGVPKFIRDKPILLRTTRGRWPTIWGEDEARELVTTRRELLTWTCDIQSAPPTKPLLRLMAENATNASEKKILEYLVSAQGQAAFCDLRTGSHITLAQLLHAFPSSQPPLDAVMSTLSQLMPRFYSLSNDPHISSDREGLAGRRLIEMAVSVHETDDWRSGRRTGVGSGFLERIARQFMDAQSEGLTSKAGAPSASQVLDLRIPMFRGLMANPLSREFVSDGPMILIGAGVGMAPFRGFILNRLKNANCANKVWLIQGVRDSMLDELYSGELGDHEKEIKKVVQSRKKDRTGNEAKYVQDEVRQSADIVWFVANALDGRVFVCGSSKGMGEGVHSALVDVVMQKGGLNKKQAEAFWNAKKEGGQYIAETW